MPGLAHLLLRRVGFAAANFDVRIQPGMNSLTARLDGAAISLDEVRIVGNPKVAGRLDDFEVRRLRKDASAVITREDIEKRHPMRLSQLLRGVGGLKLADSAGIIVAVSTRGMKPVRTPGRGFALTECVMRMAVDGVLLPPLSNLDEVLPQDIHGVEVFLGPSRVPPQFSGTSNDSWCGLIMVWTRSG